MDKNQVNRSCITNMKEKDPIIKKYMQEYMNSVQDYEALSGSDKLIVNFDITYPDGRCENFTCNGVSNIFGNKEDCNQNKDFINNKDCMNLKEDYKCEVRVEKPEKPNYPDYNDSIKKDSCDKKDYDYENYSNYDFNDCDYLKNRHSDFFEDYEKSIKYERDYEYSKDKECNHKEYNYKDDDHDKADDKKKDCEDILGKIIVYAYLGGTDGIELKGVTFNLYKINGVCPELVDCIKTDCNGRACFENIPKGSYRVIELINKKYFAKPTYINWNEVNIDKDNMCSTIYVINKMK